MTFFEAPTVSQILPVIMKNLLEYGDEVGSRNGRVKEILNARITLTNPADREVLTINRKANVFAQIAETMWVISGRNDIEWLSAYLPRAVDYADDGEHWRAGYGPRIRAWEAETDLETDGGTRYVDQLRYVVETLQSDPLSRQAVIGIWDPAVDTTPGRDKACNDFLQFQSRNGALHLTVTVRSNDVMWGWSGINAFEWSTLQEMVASILGINVGELVFNIGSLHLYEQHWRKAEQIEYENVQHRVIRFDPDHTVKTVNDLDGLLHDWFVWEQMCRNGSATYGLLSQFKEPLIRSWAAAIAYYWQRERHFLEPLTHTGLAAAIARTPTSMFPEPRRASDRGVVGQGHNLAAHDRVRAFYAFVTDLHAKKHASYGNSWKKRGEQMSILANMARKVDRLGVGDEYDSSADTVIDLLVYAIKYHCWLEGEDADPTHVDQRLDHALAETEELLPEIAWQADIPADFDNYADRLDGLDTGHKIDFVTWLTLRLAPVARDIWWAECENNGLLPDTDDYRVDLNQ